MYAKGYGTKKNVSESIKWCKLSANGGCGLASLNLANKYFILEQAAKLGDTEAMFEMSLMHHKGEEIKKYLDSAVDLYQNGIDFINDTTNFNLAEIKDDNKFIRSMTSTGGNEKNVQPCEFIGTLQDYKKYLDKEYEKIFEVNNF